MMTNATSQQFEKFDREEILSLMTAAAKSLTKRTVVVEFRDPIDKSHQGDAFQKTSGLFRINISPDFNLKKAYEVFLHEVGHIHLGHVDEPSDIDFDDFPSGIIGQKSTPQEAEEYNQKPEELEAHSFSESMDHIAYWGAFDSFGDTSIKSRLRYLAQVSFI